MATFIQEVLGLLSKKKTVKTLVPKKDYFQLGRQRDSMLVTGGYNPEMDALGIKAEDLMCVMLSNTLQGGVNYVPIFSPAIPGTNCAKGPLVNSKIYQNPTTGTIELLDDLKVGFGLFDNAGSLGAAGQVLTSTATGVQWTSSGSGTVNSVDASGGSTGLTFSGGPITTSGVLTLGGTLGVANGGTGLTATPSANQLLLGNGSGYSLYTLIGGPGISYNTSGTNLFINNTLPDQIVTLTAGANVTVTGSYPNFTIAATGTGTGTVTSVDVSGGTTGMTFTGSPITTSGTITMGGTLGYANGGTGVAAAGLAQLQDHLGLKKEYVKVQWTGNTAPYVQFPFNNPLEIPFDSTYAAYQVGTAAGITVIQTPTTCRFRPSANGLYRIFLSLHLDRQNTTNVDSVDAWLFDNVAGLRVVQLISMAPSTTLSNTRVYQGEADFILDASHEYSIITTITGNAGGSQVIPVSTYAITEVSFESLKF